MLAPLDDSDEDIQLAEPNLPPVVEKIKLDFDEFADSPSLFEEVGTSYGKVTQIMFWNNFLLRFHFLETFDFFIVFSEYSKKKKISCLEIKHYLVDEISKKYWN